MRLQLARANVCDAQQLHTMQVEAFRELLEKYRDYDTNPGNERLEKTEDRLKQDFTYYYFIVLTDAGDKCEVQKCRAQKVGAVRVVDQKAEDVKKRISPIFVLPEFSGRGIAQKAIQMCEELHGKDGWELDTILQEPKNCHLYEKMGYVRTGKPKKVNERLTLVYYEK